jgi:Uma2 family endonuclease
MTQPTEAQSTTLTIEDQPWPDDIPMPPTNLPYDDGEPMESPWHYKASSLIMASYVAARGGRMDDFYVGANMFVYFSAQQAKNYDYKGPDVFIVNNVDGPRERFYWAIWDEGGRYPDVIFELLSQSTEKEDLNAKKQLYEQRFRLPEYFCVAPEVERLLGWRLERQEFVPIPQDERGWLWSEELKLWLGPWRGMYLGEEHTWLRFYDAQGQLVLLPDEAAALRAEAEAQRAEAEAQRAEAEAQRASAAEQRAEAEAQRAADLTARLAEMEAELKRLRGET